MVRLYALICMVIFTPITYYLAQKRFKKSPKSDKDKKENLASFLDVQLLKKCLIHDYEKRKESGELKKLRMIFEKTSRALETQRTKFDINKKDHEIEEREILRLMQEDEFEDVFGDSDSEEGDEMDGDEILG